MQIEVAKTAGFCFGVNNAITTVFDLMRHVTNKKIYTFGPIIHNTSMIDHLKSLGVVPVENIDDIDPPACIVIRAHGVGKAVYDAINNKGLDLVDATCPYVKKIHDLVMDRYNKGYKIIIAGDKEHPEVKGINGWCDDQALIVSKPEELLNLNESEEKIFFSAQTTLSYEIFKSMLEILKAKFRNLEACNTICNTTIKRQKEAEELSKRVDAMLVIGSEESSNTQKLFLVCQKNCEKTYKIETVKDIEVLSNTENIKKIGITAGASTPDWIIKEVIREMENKFMNVNDINDINESTKEETIKEESVNANDENEESFENALGNTMVTLRAGDIVKGKVIGVTEDEVFVDLGYKSDGIIPFDEIGNERDINLKLIFEPGMEVEVFIEKVNDGEGNVLLSKKKVDYIRAWEMIEDALVSKNPIEATVVKVVNGGVIASLNSIGIFIPAAQLSDRYIKDLSEFMGKKVKVRIIELDRNKNKIVGSQRVLLEEEKNRLSKEVWDSIEVGKTYKGIVKSFTNFGAFVDIGGVDGLVYISQLSWQKIKHPSEVLKIGEEIEVTVLEFDREKKKISLGYKKPEDNPWSNVSLKYKVGDVIEGTVVRIVSYGCFVEIEPGVDGLVHISQISNKRIVKPDDVLTVGQKVSAKIVEMDAENKKIGLSIKEVNPIDSIESEVEVIADEQRKEEMKEIATEEDAPTSHKEDLTVNLGEVLMQKDLDLNFNDNSNDDSD